MTDDNQPTSRHNIGQQSEIIESLEIERRQLASTLDSTVIRQLSLLISQANIYTQTMRSAEAQTAVSVLLSLAKQALQQARDLENNLRPTLLESLGLEPALETMANQEIRASGVHIALTLQPMRPRLPRPLELAIFRTTQEIIGQAIRQRGATRITLHLTRDDEQITYRILDDGTVSAENTGEGIQRRMTTLGGSVAVRSRGGRGSETTIRFKVKPPVDFTERELDVLRALSDGLTNKEIALELNISPRTVKFHLDNIYAKLNVNTRTEAAIYALQQGLLSS